QPGRLKDKTGLFKEIVCDFDNPDEVQTALQPYTDRLLAATCRYEEAIQPFSKVIPFLPYIHTPSATVLEWSTEKPLMRDRLRNYDKNLVPKYQYMELDDLPKLSELVKDFTFPVVVKPSGLSKSLLVSRCENEQELKDRLKHTFKLIYSAYAREKYPGRPAVLVEEMMTGEMYSTDAYVMYDGEILCLPLVKVTTAHSLGLPGFYGYERTIPAGLSAAEVKAAHAVAKAAVKALNLSSTTAHIELFRTPQGWKIIEVAARIGGYRDDLYREAYGIEHFYNDLAVRMGVKPAMPGAPTGHAAVLNIYPEDEGYIEAIEGLAQARKLPSTLYLRQHAAPGDLALFAGNGGNLIIDGILSNKDPKQLERDIAGVRKLVKIKIKT
ncbi:MAG TPA: ATP-grasp domain-containing protein, partial [Candidatus Saccharimonadales bacterium]